MSWMRRCRVRFAISLNWKKIKKKKRRKGTKTTTLEGVLEWKSICLIGWKTFETITAQTRSRECGRVNSRFSSTVSFEKFVLGPDLLRVSRRPIDDICRRRLDNAEAIWSCIPRLKISKGGGLRYLGCWRVSCSRGPVGHC